MNEKLVSGILPDEGHMSIQEFLVMEPEDPNSPEWQRWRLGCFMESEPMRYFIIILVILNGIIIGCETDQRFDEPVVGYLFVIIFQESPFSLTFSAGGHGATSKNMSCVVTGPGSLHCNPAGRGRVPDRRA